MDIKLSSFCPAQSTQLRRWLREETTLLARGGISLGDTEVVLFPDKGQEGLTGLKRLVGRGREAAWPTQLNV